IHIQFRSPLISQYLAPLGCQHEKYIPRHLLQLSKRQLKILYRAMLAGGGDDGQERWFWTSSVRLKDDFQELLLRIGYIGICQEKQPAGNLLPGRREHRPGRGERSWMVEIWKAPFIPGIPVEPNSQSANHLEVCEEILPYQGMVFCVQVPDGIVYVRR